MKKKKKVIGDPIIINGRKLSLSKAIRAGDFIFLTGQIPFKDGAPMTSGSVEEQTEVVIKEIQKTLKEANCDLTDVVKAMVWLRERSDFAGFNEVYGRYFPNDPPARSAVISELLVDVRVEIEVVAYVGS
ncbi:MAG: RidA family protein [Paracoccaceae bacterium]|nr:RidA family protein [Paracoccaceae bacterium]